VRPRTFLWRKHAHRAGRGAKSKVQGAPQTNGCGYRPAGDAGWQFRLKATKDAFSDRPLTALGPGALGKAFPSKATRTKSRSVETEWPVVGPSSKLCRKCEQIAHTTAKKASARHAADRASASTPAEEPSASNAVGRASASTTEFVQEKWLWFDWHNGSSAHPRGPGAQSQPPAPLRAFRKATADKRYAHMTP